VKKVLIALLLVPSFAFAGDWSHISNKAQFAAAVIVIDKIIKGVQPDSYDQKKQNPVNVSVDSKYGNFPITINRIYKEK